MIFPSFQISNFHLCLLWLQLETTSQIFVTSLKLYCWWRKKKRKNTYPLGIITSVPLLTWMGGWVRRGVMMVALALHDEVASRTNSGGNTTRTITFADAMGKCKLALKLRTSMLMLKSRISSFMFLINTSCCDASPSFPSLPLKLLSWDPQPFNPITINPHLIFANTQI